MSLAEQPTPASQVKGLRLVSRILVVAGLVVGVGLPLLLSSMKISIGGTPLGFDIAWLLGVVIMLSDFGLAYFLSRRAAAIERELPPA